MSLFTCVFLLAKYLIYLWADFNETHMLSLTAHFKLVI